MENQEEKTGTKMIVLKQLPIITHQLEAVGKAVEERIASLNIDKQVATDDTIKTLKSLRADLNKEVKGYESERKIIKDGVNNPYKEFELSYKENITAKFDPAIKTLSEKIGEFETKVKEDKQVEIEKFFKELCETEKIDFLKFENTGVSINLSDSMKSYKDKCIALIDKTKEELELIASQIDEAEILVEYKQTLNAPKAITSVKARKDAERVEAEQLLLRRSQNRRSSLTQLNFVSHDMTRTMNFVSDENVMITYEEIDTLDDAAFGLKLNELQAMTIPKPKEVLQAPVENAPVTNVRPTSTGPRPSVPQREEPVQSFPSQTSKTETKDAVPKKILTAKFEIQGTFEQLTELNQYLKLRNLTYKNL
jgi:hypothetical protein